jgi:hypothetical protein
MTTEQELYTKELTGERTISVHSNCRSTFQTIRPITSRRLFETLLKYVHGFDHCEDRSRRLEIGCYSIECVQLDCQLMGDDDVKFTVA